MRVPVFVTAGVVLAALLGPGAARAQSAADDDDDVESPPVVAVFPLVTKGTLAEAMVEAVNGVLVSGPHSDQSVEILTGTELSTLLRQNPLKAVSTCERAADFERCFSRLADDIGADRMIIGRLRTDETGVVVLLLSISGTGTVEARVRQTVAATDELSRVLDGEAVAGLFGVPYVPPLEREVLEPPEPPPVLPMAADEGEPADGEAADGETDGDTAEASATAEAPSPADAAPDDELESEPAIYAVEPRPSPPPQTPSVVDERVCAEVARVDPMLIHREPQTPWLRVAGVVGAGTGVVTLVIAAVLSIHYDSLRVGLQPGTGISQREAAERYQAANDTASAANVLFFLGSAAIAGGASLVAYDVLADDHR